MSLTVSSIAADSNYDMRQVLGTSGTGLTIYTGFVDRINKDCAHSSLYSYLNISAQSITTISGTRTYTLTGNIRRILGVYDTTRDRILFGIDRATSPVAQNEKSESNPQAANASGSNFGYPPVNPLALQSGQASFFRLIGSNTMVIYPTPKQGLVLSVATEGQVVTLVNPTDTLLIPEDGRDMVVAGVNYLACLFLKRSEEGQFWLQIYEKLKQGASLI